MGKLLVVCSCTSQCERAGSSESVWGARMKSPAPLGACLDHCWLSSSVPHIKPALKQAWHHILYRTSHASHESCIRDRHPQIPVCRS